MKKTILDQNDEGMIKARERKIELSNSSEFWTLSKCDGVKAAGSNAVNIKETGLVKEIEILSDSIDHARGKKEDKKISRRLQRSLEETIEVLSSVVRMRDPCTAAHQHRVANLACAIADKMSLSKEQIAGIRIAGFIHDVGKIIQVPAEILNKPGPLTDIEFEIIKNHPKIAHDILKSIDFPSPVPQIVLQHHERLDGSGYPSGIKTKDILLETKILSVADVVEAMSSNRPYRPATWITQTLYEVEEKSGILYDRDVVNACLWLFTKKGYSWE